MLNSTRRRRRGPRASKKPTTTTKASSNTEERKSEQKNIANMKKQNQSGGGGEPSMTWVMVCAALYVLSGVTQPILMAYAQHAGLADPRCQLYMLFYYIGPASVAVTLRRRRRRRIRKKTDISGKTNTSVHTDGSANNDEQRLLSNGNSSGNVSSNINLCNNNEQCSGTSYGSTTSCESDQKQINEMEDDEYDEERSWPSRPLLIKASAIALFDIFAQSMVYTGNNMAGPTIFAIIYSSVTIWTALYSKVLLSRSLSKPQWMGVFLVVAGLSLTAMDSLAVGDSVFLGAILILVGSSLHGMTYVLSEMIMTASPSSVLSATATATKSCTGSTDIPKASHRRQEPQHISVRANCAIQGIVATSALLLWQIIYTFPRLQTLIIDPMANAGTTPLGALLILFTIALSNLLHSVTFFATLKYYPGGATSAGVLKGLQAVLVFAVSSMVLCGRFGGIEMCWSRNKFFSLVVVVCGILLYGTFTEKIRKDECRIENDNWVRGLSLRKNGNYEIIEDLGDADGGRIICV